MADNNALLHGMKELGTVLNQLVAEEQTKSASAQPELGDSSSSLKVISMGIIKQASYAKALDEFSNFQSSGV